MAKDIAIVLNNGSINSLVATALAAQQHRPVMVHVLKAASPDDDARSRARVAFEQQVAHFKPYREHEIAEPFPVLPGGPAAAKPAAPAQDARPHGPLSEALLHLFPLMALAARFAAHYEASSIYVGLRVGSGIDELAQATEFVQLWTDLLQLSAGLTHVALETPMLELDPWQVVDLAFQVGAPLERTWSCANDGEPCWACGSCRAREAAFHQAAKPDPLRTAKRG